MWKPWQANWTSTCLEKNLLICIISEKCYYKISNTVRAKRKRKNELKLLQLEFLLSLLMPFFQRTICSANTCLPLFIYFEFSSCIVRLVQFGEGGSTGLETRHQSWTITMFSFKASTSTTHSIVSSLKRDYFPSLFHLQKTLGILKSS